MNKSHQEIVETQLDVAELAIGMHVVRLDRPWEETDFLIQGFVIKDQSIVSALSFAPALSSWSSPSVPSQLSLLAEPLPGDGPLSLGPRAPGPIRYLAS